MGSHLIFERIGVRKYARTLSTMVVAPAMTSRALVGTDKGFVPWDNLSNLWKS